MLGVSERTIRRRRETFDTPSTGQGFSQIDDDEIDGKTQGILQISPNSGERMIMAGSEGRGYMCNVGELGIQYGGLNLLAVNLGGEL